MAIDLTTMSSKELSHLLTDVKKALKGAEKRDRREALKAAENAAAEYGFSLSELSDSAGKKRGKAAGGTGSVSAPKYANPDDSSLTWTGKGRQPNWYRAAISNGKSPEEMEL